MVIQVGVVVPTMGSRPEFILKCLKSIRAAGNSVILIVAPEVEAIKDSVPFDLYDNLLTDPGKGLAAAIDFGITNLPSDIKFVTWLGDDDLLTPNSLSLALAPLLEDEHCVYVFGSCDYINSNDQIIWENRSGNYAIPLLHFGPQLIPQPGSIIRRSAYSNLGGLDHRYKWAFDLDLIIRLKNLGSLRFVDQKLAKFRWHDGSLSVGGRAGSVREASQIRRKSLPLLLRLISPVWEFPLRKLIIFAGNRMSKRLPTSKGIR